MDGQLTAVRWIECECPCGKRFTLGDMVSTRAIVTCPACRRSSPCGEVGRLMERDESGQVRRVPGKDWLVPAVTAFRSEGGDVRPAVVETGDERAGASLVDGVVRPRQRRARVRFGSGAGRGAAHEAAKPPELGDPWCPLTVRARLQRMAEVFRRIPHTPDTKPGGYRSCMPDIVREVFKDQKGEPMRVPVGSVDLADAMQVLDALIQMTDDQRIMAWGVAARIPATTVMRYLRCSDKTARDRMQDFLTVTASDWQARAWSPSEPDVRIAREFINRKV